MSQAICVLCSHYHPHSEPHPPDRGQACPSGRRRLENEVLTLRSSYRRLLEQNQGNEALIPDPKELPPEREWGAADPTNRDLPAATVPSPSKQPAVSGSRERQIPLTDVADLTAAARTGSVRDPYGDQQGRHSVATMLNEWIGSWHEAFFPQHRRPAPTVEAMLGWLLGVRLELVSDAEPAIADFAAEVAELNAVILYHLGEIPPKRQPMWGVPCPRCDLMSQLTLDPQDPDKYRECANCGKLMTAHEYQTHLRELVDRYRAGHNLARGSTL